jgi:hypothetical protein
MYNHKAVVLSPLPVNMVLQVINVLLERVRLGAGSASAVAAAAAAPGMRECGPALSDIHSMDQLPSEAKCAYRLFLVDPAPLPPKITLRCARTHVE